MGGAFGGRGLSALGECHQQHIRVVNSPHKYFWPQTQTALEPHLLLLRFLFPYPASHAFLYMLFCLLHLVIRTISSLRLSPPAVFLLV